MRLTITLKKSRINYYAIFTLLVLTFIAAAVHIIDCRQAYSAGIPKLVTNAVGYAMVALSFIYIAVFLLKKGSVTFLTASTILYLIYETLLTLCLRSLSYSLVRSLITDGYVWPLTMLAFYLYFRYEYQGEPARKTLKALLVIGTAVAVVLMIPNLRRHLIDYGYLGRAIGPLYYLVAFLPFLYVFCKRKTYYLFMIAIFAIVLISTKRAALLVVVLGFVLQELARAQLAHRMSQRVKRYLAFFGAAVLIALVGFWYFNRFGIATISRLMNVLDDGGSGRTVAWGQVIRAFRASSLSKRIFGHGFHAVPSQVMPLGRGIYAHCSYLEVLYDMGIFGLVWLLVNLVYIFVQFFKMVKARHYLAPALAFSSSLLVILSAIGYFYEQSTTIVPVVILWSMCVGLFQNRNLQTDLQEALPARSTDAMDVNR